MTLPETLVCLRHPGDAADNDPAAVLDEQGGLVLEPREAVLYTSAGSLEIAGLGKLQDTPVMHITNHRIVWIDPTYNDNGGGWFGLGAGAIIAVAANAVSHHRAKNERAGRVAVVTARHEWLVAVTLRNEKALIGVVDSFLDLHVRTAHGIQLLQWWMMRSAVTRDVVERLAVTVTMRWQQLGHGVLEPEELAHLSRYAAGGFEDAGRHGSKGWLLPDKVDLLDAHQAWPLL